MKRGLYMVLILASIIMLIGVAGASDNEAINIIKADALCALSCIATGIGLFGLWLEDAREKNKGEYIYVEDGSDEREDI